MANTKITAANIDSTSTGFTLADLTVDKGATGDIAHFEGQGSTHLKIGEASNVMYLNANNGTAEIAFQSNAVEKMRLDSAGNLGVGVTDPQTKLHIEVADNTEFLRATITGNESWAFKGASVAGTSTDTVSFGIAGGTQCMTWQEDGNVGIGNNNPSYALDVYDVGEAWIRADSSHTTESTANSGLRFAHGGVNHGVLYHRGSDDALLYFDNIASSTRFLINSSGNFGIGTDNPTGGKLHVVGDVFAESGSFYVGANGVVASDSTSRNLSFGIGNTTAKMTLDTSGRLHLGSTIDTNHKGLTISKTTNDSYTPSSFNDESLLRLYVPNAEGNYAGITYTHDGGTEFFTGLVRVGATADISDYVFQGYNGNTNAYQEYFRIDSSGRVGIGVSPSEALHIEYNTVSGGDNYIHMRKTDQGAGQGVFIGMPTASNNLRIMNHANNAITFHTQTSDAERFRIDTNGVRLEDGAMAYEQNRPLFTGANAASYSTSTNLAYTKETDQYSVTGDAFKARVRARAYTKYVHMKTNLTADNIMFFFRIYGYFYNYGVNECVRGGYTYNGSVITESVANAYNANSSYTIGDFYRSSSGGYLCVRLDVHQTGYTEGEALVFFASHANTVTRELEITDMQHRDDGNNAY